MPTSTALGCVQVSPDSDVIGTNYDGTTPGKKRRSLRNGISPRNSLFPFAGKPRLAGLPAIRGPRRDDGAGGREPLLGCCDRGFDPVAYFVDARPLVGLPEFETSDAGAVWRFRSEGNRASFVAHPDIYGPSSGATTRSIWRAGSPLPATPGFG